MRNCAALMMTDSGIYSSAVRFMASRIMNKVSENHWGVFAVVEVLVLSAEQGGRRGRWSLLD